MLVLEEHGEDVLAQLTWFSHNSTRALCVLSANGAVYNVTLRQSATSGGTVTYEGRFEILSLSGSFMVSEVAGQRSRTGGLSVALSGPDGRVLGGNVAGLLIAASPVQVIVGSFVPSSQKQTKTAGNNEVEVVNAPATESYGGGLSSPLDHSNNSNPQAMANMPWRLTLDHPVVCKRALLY
ncbi:AT-hook motif nuclear-localized protein 10-like protein [Tanacetum coccineum]